MRIAVASAGYMGLSVALLRSQDNDVRTLDIVPGKVEALRRGESPIRDEDIELFLTGQLSGLSAGSHPDDYGLQRNTWGLHSRRGAQVREQGRVLGRHKPIVGVYRLTMKRGSDSYSLPAMVGWRQTLKCAKSAKLLRFNWRKTGEGETWL